MSRVDQVGEQSIFSDLERLRAIVDELKAAQRTGASSLLLRLNATTNAVNVDSGYQSFAIASGGTVNTLVQWTSATQDWAFVDLSYRVFIDSPTAEAFPGSANYPVISVSTNLVTTPVVKQNNWSVKVSNFWGASHTYYFRFYVQSSDAGVFV